MHEAWTLDWTEYEFGQRPDGTSLHIDLGAAVAFRKTHSTGSPDCFWRSDEPKKVWIDNEKLKELKDNNGNIWLTTHHWYVPKSVVC